MPNRDPAKCETMDELLLAAQLTRAELGPRSIELNAPANIIMELGAAKYLGRPVRLDNIETYAEESLLQLGLLNAGVNPGSSFVTQAYEAGWRYRLPTPERPHAFQREK